MCCARPGLRKGRKGRKAATEEDLDDRFQGRATLGTAGGEPETLQSVHPDFRKVGLNLTLNSKFPSKHTVCNQEYTQCGQNYVI